MNQESSSKKRRLFIAIKIPNELKKNLVNFQKQFETKDINWTKFENLHITVQFLGWVDENKIFSIEKDIEKAAQVATPFNLNFENIIFAPPQKTKRMIWAVFNCEGQYEKLVKNIFESMKKYINLKLWNENIMRRERTSHITLARFKNLDIAKNIDLKRVRIENKKFKVSEISLWESKLSRDGAKYQILNKFNFK